MGEIPRSDLELMFADMRERAPWYTDGDLAWGYFFMDSGTSRLRRLAERLTSMGYRLVGIHKTRGFRKYTLQVERIETHTVDSLDDRNRELNGLAAEYGVASYDGMDVGAAPSEQALQPDCGAGEVVSTQQG